MADPDWEIDTRHLGFESWRHAACFANGLTEEGVCALFLYEGVMVLQLVNGREMLVDDGETVVWHRERPHDAISPEEAPFFRTAVDLSQLSAIGLDGAFSAMYFGVDDLRDSRRIDVRVEADARRRTVLVTLAVVGDGTSGRDDSPGGAPFDVAQA